MKKFTASSRILFLFVIISIVLIEVNELRVEHMASDPQGEVQPVIRVLPGNPWINISSQGNGGCNDDVMMILTMKFHSKCI